MLRQTNLLEMRCTLNKFWSVTVRFTLCVLIFFFVFICVLQNNMVSLRIRLKHTQHRLAIAGWCVSSNIESNSYLANLLAIVVATRFSDTFHIYKLSLSLSIFILRKWQLAQYNLICSFLSFDDLGNQFVSLFVYWFGSL